MTKNIIKSLLLLLIAPLVLAQDSYPKKLIIQNSKNNDTVIAFTNEQVIKINQEHIVLKQCIDYSNIQDSIITFQIKTIEELKKINSSYVILDSISNNIIKDKDFLLSISYKEKEDIKETFTNYQKQVKKQKRNNWFYNTLITIPTVVSLSVILTYLLIK